MHKKRRTHTTFKIIVVFIAFLSLGIVLFYENNRNVHYSKKKNNVKVLENNVEIDENGIFHKYHKKALDLLNKMTLEEKIGQLFLVRYDNNLIKDYASLYPGGYILFARDFENHTKESIKNQIESNQTIHKYPLIMAVDEEGGLVTRISRFRNFRDEKFQSPRYYYEQGGYELLEKMENEKISLLKSIGINLNLAPVVDVSTNENDFIYERSFGKSFEETSEFVSNMVSYSNNNQMNSCLKHFPGYGNNVDTHTGIAIDNRSYESFLANDFLPFQAGIKANVPCVLVSHNIITAMDDKYPASLSKKVIDELRDTLGFTGIVITDDLAMDAVKSYVDSGNAATLAINSGNDMIITSDFESMYDEVLNSVKNGIIDEKTINKAVLRIIEWKYYSNLFN